MNIPHHVAKLAEFFARHPWRVLTIALILSALAGWAAIQLPVYTSRQALLPPDAEVTKRLNSFLKKFGAASDLVLVIEGRPREELETFANELATRLQAEPEIAQASAKLDTRFFFEHGYLLMPSGRLEQLKSMAGRGKITGLDDGLNQALKQMRQPAAQDGAGVDLQSVNEGLGAANFLLKEWQRWLSAEQVPQSVDWTGLLAEHGAAGMAKGYFASRDGKMLFLFVHPKNPSEDFENLGPFVDKVKQVSANLAAQTQTAGRAPPTVGLTGLPAIEYEEYINIRSDIKLVMLTSAALIAGLVLVVVRSVRWAVIIFIPMGLGVLWSLGLALYTVGHLTIITAAFIAILFGLGADYGIFTSSRIAEERRAGKPLIEAIGAGIGSSFIAVLTAGGASLLIFGVLGTVDFTGFAELGVVAAKGVLMILISTWVVQPALYVLMPPKLGEIAPDTADAISMVKTNKLGGFPKPLAVALVVVAVAGAIGGTVKGLKIPFDYDVLAMLPKDSQAAYYQRRMVAESDYQAEVVIYTAADLDEARRITAEAGKLKTVAQVQSLTNLFPTDAQARLDTAKAVAQTFAAAGLEKTISQIKQTGLSEKSFNLIRTLLEEAKSKIEDAQEQAFSAGHAELVKSLERVRGDLQALQKNIAADGPVARVRSEAFMRALLTEAELGLKLIDTWRQAIPLTPQQLPPTLKDRFFAADGAVAVYAFPAKAVYDPANLDELMAEIYTVSPNATGFPTTHQVFSKAVVESFSRGTLMALAVCLVWIILALRSLSGCALASLPLLIGGGWMLGLLALAGVKYNYANIIALPLVIALAVDYGVWFSYRWRELKGYSPFQVSLIAGKVIGLAAGTELAGLGAITLASYRGVSSLGVSVTIGLLCCLTATLIVAPAIGQLLDPREEK